MLDQPWPPPGAPQARDAHAAMWSNDVGRRARRPARATGVATDLWTHRGGREPAAHRRVADDPGQAPAVGDRDVPPARPVPASWLPQEEWIPDPTPSPERMWTPEQDWAAPHGVTRTSGGSPASGRAPAAPPEVSQPVTRGSHGRPGGAGPTTAAQPLSLAAASARVAAWRPWLLALGASLPLLAVAAVAVRVITL